MIRAFERGGAVRLQMLAVSLLAFALSHAPASAQTGSGQPERATASAAANYLTPFPEKDTWRALVIGDGMAEGLLGGLVDAMQGESRIRFQRGRKSLSALGRADMDYELRTIDDRITKEGINIAIVMLGIADRSGVRLPNGRRLGIGSDAWRAEYAGRVDRLVKALRRKGVAVYWIGLPIMRRQDMSDDVEAMNNVYRERAIGNGARFIDIYTESADESGQFSDRGPDITGKVVRLRDSDGVDFTPPGYRKIAFFVERTLKRDMTQARNERAVPLAGTEEEQRRLRTIVAAAKAIDAAQKGKTGKSGQRVPLGTAPAIVPVETLPPDQRAENVRVSFKTIGAAGKFDQVSLEIIRPALSPSLVALVTRRDKGDRPSPVGDTVTDTLSNGLMIVRSITPTTRQTSRSPRERATRQPFFIALTKGERLPPKPGRADDFRWPREDDLPAPPVGESARAEPIASPVQLGRPARRVRGRN